MIFKALVVLFSTVATSQDPKFLGEHTFGDEISNLVFSELAQLNDVFPCQYWVKKNNVNSRWYDLKPLERSNGKYFDTKGYDDDRIMFNLCTPFKPDANLECKDSGNAFGFIV